MRCGEEAHAPSSCALLTRWLEKCQNESETANWILANTKRCPKCQTRIEKNQGCNHMQCQQCKYDFCWMCLGPWGDHGGTTGGYYKCNKYDPTKDADDDGDAAKAKRELDRYLHYYKRYHGHHQAQQFATKQLEATEKRMVEFQEQSKGSWIDVQFLKAANEMVIDCRRVLKATYIFGYTLDPQKQRAAASSARGGGVRPAGRGRSASSTSVEGRRTSSTSVEGQRTPRRGTPDARRGLSAHAPSAGACASSSRTCRSTSRSSPSSSRR